MFYVTVDRLRGAVVLGFRGPVIGDETAECAVEFLKQGASGLVSRVAKRGNHTTNVVGDGPFSGGRTPYLPMT